MRFATIASAIVLAASTAAIAQVGSAPEEQKLATNEAAADDAAPVANGTGNAAVAEPGAPSTALVNSVDRTPPTDTRPRP